MVKKTSKVSTISDAVDLIERFVNDAPMRYNEEWDDFLSWPSIDPDVDRIRLRAGEIFQLNIGSSSARSRMLTELARLVSEARSA
jgi:hypothetical protein